MGAAGAGAGAAAGINIDKLVTAFSGVDESVTSQINALQNLSGKNINVAQYMQLQVAMNKMSQVGQLITQSVSSLNHMAQSAIQGFRSQ